MGVGGERVGADSGGGKVGGGMHFRGFTWILGFRERLALH